MPRLILTMCLAIWFSLSGITGLAAQSSPPPTPMAPPDQNRLEEASVAKVVDGDTIDVMLNGRTSTSVRLIGVDTPETVHPSQPVGCFGPEASEFTNTVLPKATVVWLEKDVSETDRYGRLLRYVWVDPDPTNAVWHDLTADGIVSEETIAGDDLLLVNWLLVRAGYAVSSTYPPDVKYQEDFLTAERAARETQAGLWGECSSGVGTLGGGSAITAPSPTVANGNGSSGESVGGNCDPSYPDVCIAPAPPDLDCGQIPQRRFTVLPPDPHGFDGDHDGIGCES